MVEHLLPKLFATRIPGDSYIPGGIAGCMQISS